MNIDYDALGQIINEFQRDFLEKEKIYSDKDLDFSMKEIKYSYSTSKGIEFTITLNRNNDE